MTIQSDAKRLEEVNQRGEVIRQTARSVTASIRTLVDQLLAKYPDHNKTIRRCLEGEAQRLLSEAEKAKRAAAEAAYAKESAAKIKKKAAAEKKKKKKA